MNEKTNYEKISEFEKRLKENPESGQALHLAMKTFAALELLKAGFDVKLEKSAGRGKIRFDVVGKKDDELKVIECATHRKDVERSIDKVKNLPLNIGRILVTTKKTLEDMSFDIEKIDVKKYFDEIWIPDIDFNLTCSEGTSNLPASLQLYFSLRKFTKYAGHRIE
jgi:hypothetical protein